MIHDASSPSESSSTPSASGGSGSSPVIDKHLLDALDAEAAEAVLTQPTKPLSHLEAEKNRGSDGDGDDDEAPSTYENTGNRAYTGSLATVSNSSAAPAELATAAVVGGGYASRRIEELPVSHARLSGSVFNAEDATREPGPMHPLQGSLIAPETFLVQNRQVSIGGVLLEELKAAYGTPLYILDATTIRSACRAYKQTLQSEYGDNHLLVYACKANLTLGLCKLLESEGFGLDVVSAGELYTAIKAKFPAERIVMNGNNKSPQEVALALDYGINRLIIDNASELPVIAGEAKRLGTVANVLIRVSPGIECHTHEYIRTGQADSKFGVPLSQLASLIETIQKDYAGTIALKGLQAHIGSQIFELKAYQDLVKIMLNVVYNIRQEYDLELEDLDIGGGLGIAYTEADDPQPIATLVRQSATLLATYADKLQLKRPRLLMEPGRSLIARAGCTLYTVGTRKDIEGYPSFVAVDGGMGDNIRPALYQAEYTAIAASKVFEPATETVKLVGKYCESGDILLREFQTPQLQPGDLVLLFGTGAYNYTMASHYNRFPKPAMVLVEDGRSALLSKRDTLDDLIANDLIPEWLLTN